MGCFLADISCRRVPVRSSNRLSQVGCSTETTKRRIVQITTLHNSPGTVVFWCGKSRQNSSGVTPNGGAKCRLSRLNAGAVAENWRISTRSVVNLVRSQVYLHWASTLFVCSTFAAMQRVAPVCQRQLILVYIVCFVLWRWKKIEYFDSFELSKYSVGMKVVSYTIYIVVAMVMLVGNITPRVCLITDDVGLVRIWCE